jgi:hypothetical protein
MQIGFGNRDQDQFGRGMLPRQRRHVVAAVDRNDGATGTQQATGKHAAELAETDDDDFMHVGSRE